MINFTTPLVSVIMPVYNGERFLREAIDSILNQTYYNFELIIINDGSIDRSEETILSYTDSRIRYLVNEKNSGICVTLNKGLDVAKGKYVARLDCDDIAMPERFAKQVVFLEQHPEIGVLGSDIVTFGEGQNDRYFDFVHDKEGCKAGLVFASCFAHPAVMLRTSVIREHNLHYDDAYRGLEDFELWYRISHYTDLTNLPEALTRYRKHPAQVTQNVTKQVSDKEKGFLHDRFLQYAPFSQEQLLLVEYYAFNHWEMFDNNNINDLFSIFISVIKSDKVCHSRGFCRAMKITLSKALAFIFNNAPKVTANRTTLYTKALFKGLMPFDWYCKFMYHVIR